MTKRPSLPKRPRLGQVIGTAAKRPVLVCFGTQPGGTTLDDSVGGGNPFATALIEVAAERALTLQQLPARLAERTAVLSGAHQLVEASGTIGAPDWRFDDLPWSGEARLALVLVVSDYAASRPDASLPGAARDERRIASMVASHGFSVEQGIGPTRKELMRALGDFRRRSRRVPIAFLYSTGHGVELGGKTYLLPGDYPLQERVTRESLDERAIGIDRLIDSAGAGRQNLVFFAGCRRRVEQGAGKQS